MLITYYLYGMAMSVLRIILSLLLILNFIQVGYFFHFIDAFAIRSHERPFIISSSLNVNPGISKDSKYPATMASLSPDNSIQAKKEIKVNYNNNNSSLRHCNCVVFRMDDIQDYWIEPAQLAAMNLFMSKNQTLSLGLIMNYLGNDSKIIDKITQGYHKGLFELALHGWNHVDYSKLSEEEQQHSLQQANEKMKHLFGSTSNMFIAPYDRFNNDTLKAMSQLGLRILSSFAYEEDMFNHNSSVFIADAKSHNNETKQTVYHLPGTIGFKDYVNGKWIKTPDEKILTAINNNIAKYGYAVIVFHPQDLAKLGLDGKFTNGLDENDVKDLLHLIDSVLSGGKHITSFSQIVREYGPSTSTAFINKAYKKT
jgi:peptidoglycan/xylan/chitin deacetylase (PgdA/CDA1 family)